MKIFDVRTKKHRVSCYAWRNPTCIGGYIPQFRYSKTIQGWSYTRCASFAWLYYAISCDFTLINFWGDTQTVAHNKNLSKYKAKQGITET